MDSTDAIRILRAKLGVSHAEGYGEVTFHRTDGQTVVIDNIRVDSIGPQAANTGVVSADDGDDKIYHLPFVAYWTVDYRF